MPAGNDKEYQFVSLDDFSPGIYDDYYASSGAQAAPLGAAQLSGTYGCVAAMGGGLIPAPRLVNRVLESPQSSPSSSDPYTHITAFKALSPVHEATGTLGVMGTPRAFPDQLFVAFEWYNSANRHRQLARTYKMFRQTGTYPTLGSVSTYDLMSNTSTDPVSTALLLYGFSSFDISRNKPSDPTQPGYPTVGISYTDSRDIFNVQPAVMYPSSATPTTDSTQTMAGLNTQGGTSAYTLFAHQDRMNRFGITVNFGFGTNGEVPFDGIQGTAPNDFLTLGYTTETFVNENPGLFGSWVSMNASEAFLVKQQHGGYSLRGDVANPTIVRLPGVEPTGNAINIGTIDGNGMYIYGTRNGVYGWSGGDTSPYLSPQIDGWFWKPGSGLTGVDQYLFTKGQFGRLGRYVFAPNNFIFDSAKGGWWKLTNPSDTTSPTYGFWDTSAGNYMIGAPVYLGGGQNVLFDYYDVQQGQSSYSWTSQPLKVTQGRVVVFREIDLIAQGVGTVVITLMGLDGETGTWTYPVNSPNRPTTINQMGSCHSHDVVVHIASTATDSSDPAPRIYRAAMGYEAQETARSAS